MSKSKAMNTFSQNLKRILEARGWSKQHLADLCGIDRAYVSRLISGEHSPSLELSERIANACDLELYEILTPKIEIEVFS